MMGYVNMARYLNRSLNLRLYAKIIVREALRQTCEREEERRTDTEIKPQQCVDNIKKQKTQTNKHHRKMIPVVKYIEMYCGNVQFYGTVTALRNEMAI
jgi:hypothetical protein